MVGHGREFLKEHWQKLISGLAVLLIVVSSTVGASLVLGPLLWSPAGKGVLALGFTAICAAFGAGLVRWGAERAGRVMLATSLFVVPINLMLLGGLHVLAAPSTMEVGLVALDAALLLALTRWVVGRLGLGSPEEFTASYFGLAAFNAGASAGMPFGPGFAVFLAPCVLFLGSVSRLNRRVGVEGLSPRPGEAYLESGLLGFAFLSGVARTGAAVLHLNAPLYAIPALLASVAAVSTARAIAPIEKDRRLVLLFQQGGLTLSALAFALALARPPGPSALFSGNTLAVAVLGLALYATSLRATRQPAFLYAGFGALVVAYFGAFYFASDLVHSVEEAARRAMGYDRKLPLPFKAINGLAFNVGLAWLSGFFRRKWSDDRLARHCHAIGLPLSVAACVLSGFEPKAAVICLGGYAVLYAVAARIFAEPRLIYLACSATAGAACFGASLLGHSSPEELSVIAAALGLAWAAIRGWPGLGSTYQGPLVHASRAMAAVALAGAALGSVERGLIPPVATLGFVLAGTLALLNGREAPRASVFLVAFAALLGAWLGGFHLLNGGRPASMMTYGLVVACFPIALLLLGEAATRWLEGSGETVAYREALAPAVVVLVAVAWALAVGSMVDSVTVARSFLVGSSNLLWLTRFRRDPVLVYLGLGGLAVWAGCLCGLVVPGGEPARLWSWLAVTVGGCSLAFWAVGERARRRDSSFYDRPLLAMAAVLAGLAVGLAAEGRWLSIDAYRPGVAAMLLASMTFGLVAASRRWPGGVSLSSGSTVGAVSLALLSQGSSSDGGWVLALAAALGAIACRGAGLAIRRGSGDLGSAMARPLDDWALALTLGAAPLDVAFFGSGSPAASLAIAAASLLLIGCFPSALWLYGTFAALALAAYQAGGWRYSGDGLIPFVVIGAYLAWGVGAALRRYGPGLLERLGLLDLPLHEPASRVALALGAVAAAIRVDAIVRSGSSWTGSSGLPWALAGLCLLTLRVEPRRVWAHLAVGLTGLGYWATLGPWIESGGWWLSASVMLAGLWAVVGRFEGRGRRALGIEDDSGPGVIDEWSRAAAGLVGLALVVVVVFGTFVADSTRVEGWPDVMLALGLAGGFVGLEWRKLGRDSAVMVLESLGVLALWWAAAPGSPLVGRLGLDPGGYLPIATASAALVLVLVGLRMKGRSLEAEAGTPLAPRDRLVEFTSAAGFGLGVAAVYLSVGRLAAVSLPTLWLATAALGLLAVAWGRVGSAIAGGLTWCLAWAVGTYWAARGLGVVAPIELARVVALGFVAAQFGLWWGSGWALRRAEDRPAGRRRAASALGWVAIATTFAPTVLAYVDGEGAALTGSVVLFALAVFFGLVAWRKGSDWPSYLAQGFVLACYFRARPVVGLSNTADSVVLSLLAYLDVGLSEWMGRLRRPDVARSTFRFAMVLPLVPILQGLWVGGWDEVGLFVLLATAAFYSLAGWRLRSKVPAYASAVFFNSFLWMAWHRLGWQLGERPQFYLIPVGFSAILLAEVNRRELGQSMVNGLRNLGLVVIYASLAPPIWQSQSFGAWLALLLLSLAGIFAGIALRVQSFLWLGLLGFVLDLLYQIGRVGVDHALARWGVMLSLGVALILFVALNEKKRIVATLKDYYDEARTWE